MGHKRGGFCTKASTVLRSLYPIILGLGGWLLGTLIVLATLPSVPIDDELLVALSIGVPAGLGIYLAWMHRDWSAQNKHRTKVSDWRPQSLARSQVPGSDSLPRLT